MAQVHRKMRLSGVKQKTIRLIDHEWIYDSEYRLDDGVVQRLNYNYEWVDTDIAVGKRFTLVSIEDVSPGPRYRKTLWRLVTGPVPGNAGPQARYHGWRGTTNDRAVYAHGERTVIKIRQLKSGFVAVTLGRDLRPFEL